MARPPPRLHTDEPLAAGAVLTLDATLAHYLGRVLRLTVGDAVLLFNGRDGEWAADIIEIDRRQARLAPTACRRAQANPRPLQLLFAPVKKSPCEVLVQKATELGVTALCPVITARTVDRAALPRWRTIATEAAEQSERLTVPDLSEPASLAEVLAREPDAPLLFCDEGLAENAAPTWAGDGDDRSCLRAMDAQMSQPWRILIGPAGGFSDEERALLAAQPNCLAVRLGPRILKAETAAIVALTLWQSCLGDL